MEFLLELRQRQPGGGREFGQLVRILKIVFAQPNHVAARDVVPRRIDVHEPGLRPARLGIQHVLEGNGNEPTRLHRHHRPSPPLEQRFGRAVAKVGRVLHIEREWVCAAQLVADVLGHDGGFDSELLQSFRDV